IVIGQIVGFLKLPVYFDSIGTVLVAVMAGPWAGALTGALSNVVWGLLLDPSAFPWFPVGAAIGLVAGLCANAGLFRSWWKVNLAVFGGITPSGSSLITAFLLSQGFSTPVAVVITNLLAEPLDKIPTCLLAWAIIKGLSVRYVARFPRASNVGA